MHVSQIIILYTLKLYTTVCQLQLNKAEKKCSPREKRKEKTTSEPENQTENYPVQDTSCYGELGGWVAREATAGGINQVITFLQASPLLFLLVFLFFLSYYLCYSPMCTASTSTWCRRFLSFIKPIGKDCPEWVTLNSIDNLWEALRMPLRIPSDWVLLWGSNPKQAR